MIDQRLVQRELQRSGNIRFANMTDKELVTQIRKKFHVLAIHLNKFRAGELNNLHIEQDIRNIKSAKLRTHLLYRCDNAINKLYEYDQYAKPLYRELQRLEKIL